MLSNIKDYISIMIGIIITLNDWWEGKEIEKSVFTGLNEKLSFLSEQI